MEACAGCCIIKYIARCQKWSVSCTLWLHQAEVEPHPGIQRTFKEGPSATCKPSCPKGQEALALPPSQKLPIPQPWLSLVH